MYNMFVKEKWKKMLTQARSEDKSLIILQQMNKLQITLKVNNINFFQDPQMKLFNSKHKLNKSNNKKPLTNKGLKFQNNNNNNNPIIKNNSLMETPPQHPLNNKNNNLSVS
jgi:hypothetical protein